MRYDSWLAFLVGIAYVLAKDPSLIQDDIDNGRKLADHLLGNMERDAQKVIYEPIKYESDTLQKFARWTPEFKNAMMETSYSSSFSRPHWNAAEIQKNEVEDFDSKNVLKEIGLEPKNEFDRFYGEDSDEKKQREDKQSLVYGASDKAMEQVLQQTQNAMAMYNKVYDEASRNDIRSNITTEDSSSLNIDPLSLSIASMALGGNSPEGRNPATPNIPVSQGQGADAAMAAFQNLLGTQSTSTDGSTSGSNSGTTQSGGSAANDAGFAAGAVGSMMGAMVLPAILRGYLRQEHFVPNKESGPKIMSHDATPFPSEIQGYNEAYYASLASSKDVPMWWSHSGAHMTPPWFQSNAPPNRAHLGRAAVNVPAPPFIDSPYRSTILDYWTGKRSKFIAPVPKPWPTHHMMADLNGDGNVKCPCPGAPQLMCDCSAIEYNTIATMPKTDDDKLDPVQALKKRMLEATRQVLGNMVRAPYPEMMLMGTLM